MRSTRHITVPHTPAHSARRERQVIGAAEARPELQSVRPDTPTDDGRDVREEVCSWRATHVLDHPLLRRHKRPVLHLVLRKVNRRLQQSEYKSRRQVSMLIRPMTSAHARRDGRLTMGPLFLIAARAARTCSFDW